MDERIEEWSPWLGNDPGPDGVFRRFSSDFMSLAEAIRDTIAISRSSGCARWIITPFIGDVLLSARALLPHAAAYGVDIAIYHHRGAQSTRVDAEDEEFDPYYLGGEGWHL